MQKVLIIDFGSQVTKLIARCIREIRIYCEILPCSISLQTIKEFAPVAIIFSGGPSSIFLADSPKIDYGIFKLGIPILGICYGQQYLCDALGGIVKQADIREYGKAELTIKKPSPIFGDDFQEASTYPVWMSHSDKIEQAPSGFEVLATTPHCPFAIIGDDARKIYGVQFHPEVSHTQNGKKLIENFLLQIANITPSWNMNNFLEHKIPEIRNLVGQSKVLCAVSGGVDSSVVATLIHRAIGDNLKCFFIDTGLLRQDEATKVQKMFANYHIPLKSLDKSGLFLSRLKGVSDPEEKRKIIGRSFIEVFEEQSQIIKQQQGGELKFLAQGTLYPDVIESLSMHGGKAVTIKSHHNVGGLPEKMNLALLEPVRELFKDEVRKLGAELGITQEMMNRHPFPGPGLAIRIPGEVTAEKIAILQNADEIYINAIKEAGLYDDIWQAFAVLLPVKTVGVMGDNRTYEYVCALRAVNSSDGMTANYYPFSHDFLAGVATQIVNNVKGINRVVYDITSKPPGTIEWE